jgi:hypothetical protein
MTTELDNYIPRKYPGNDALGQLKPGETESVGALYSAHHASATANRRIAALIGELWGVNYLAAGPGVQGTMRQAGRQVLLECEGDISAVEGLIEKMKADPKWAAPCKLCQSAYSIAGRIKAYRAVQLSLAEKTAAANTMEGVMGMSYEEWEAEAAENARIRAEWLARKHILNGDEGAKTE